MSSAVEQRVAQTEKPRSPRGLDRARREERTAYLFLAPGLILFLVFMVIPMIAAAPLAA